jgi:hypothetical protein
MDRLGTRKKHAYDLEIRYPDGRVVLIEVKRGSGVRVRDLMSQAQLYVSGASAAAIGAASVFGWYVRSGAPWAERGGDDAAIRGDWQTVGDDLWRATGAAARIENGAERDQDHLFDPAEYARQG